MPSPTALIATPGAANANAYIDVTTADQFHLDHPQFGTTAATGLWSGASADQKVQAILWATKLMDRQFIWNGSIVNTIQVLLWPRSGLVQTNDWNVLDNTTIPDLVAFATAEYARQLLMSERLLDSDIQTQGLTSLRVGSLAMTFKQDVIAKQVPDAVVRLIPEQWGYLRGSRARRLMRT